MTKRSIDRALETLRAELWPSLSAEEREQLEGVLGEAPVAVQQGTAPVETIHQNREVTVTWDDPDPEQRPTGIRWDRDSATLTYDLWDAQHEALEALLGDDQDIVAFLGGYGSGKSMFGARWLIAQALAYPGSRFLAMGTDFANARGSTFRILKEQLPGGAGSEVGTGGNPETSPIVTKYHKSDNRLRLFNGSVIRFGSGQTWNRVAGDEYGAIWLDEASQYQANLHELREMLGGRLRGQDGPSVQCWTLTGNGYHDAWEILEQRQDRNGDPIRANITLVRAATLDNPYLTEDTIAGLRRQFADTARADQALRGAFSQPQGLVYDDFQPDTHVIDEAAAWERIEEDWRIYGYDAGWADPRVVLEIGRTPGGQLVVVDLFHERGSHPEQAIDWLEEEDKPRGRLYADHEPSEIDKFRRAGYRTRKATKALDPGIEDVRRRLRRDDGGRIGLVVSEQVQPLIGEFRGYQEDEVGTGQATDHCLDALRYAVHGLDQGERIGSWDEPSQDTVPILDIGGVVGDGYYGV